MSFDEYVYLSGDWTFSSPRSFFVAFWSVLFPPFPALVVIQSFNWTTCPTLRPHGCSMPGFPVLNHLLEFAQTHVHWVSDAIQPSHPLPSPSPPTFNLSQHQGLLHWVSCSHQVATVLELQLQSFQWIFRVDFLQDWLVGSSCSPRDSQESSPTPQFKSINSSALSLLYGPNSHSLTWLLEKPQLWLDQPLSAK